MAHSYLYVVEMATTGTQAEPDTGQWATIVKTAFNFHPDIQQYKCLVGNWAGFSNGTQFIALIPWSVIMFVQTEHDGLKKAEFDVKAQDIMQRIKNVYPGNIVVGVNWEVALQTSLF